MLSSRLKNWKTMPMCLRRMIASSSSDLPTSDSPASVISPSVGGVEAGDEVEQRRLAATRRAHDRDELARLHREVDAAQRAHGRALGLEVLAQAPGHEDRALVGHGAPPVMDPPSAADHLDT